MYNTQKVIKKKLRAQYEKACNAYVNELLKMWDLEACYGYWNSDKPGTIYHYGDTHNLSMEDIIYIVENDIERDEVLEWEDYLLDAHEFHFNLPNLQSWHKGCPRVPEITFARLRAMKADLEKAVVEERNNLKTKEI